MSEPGQEDPGHDGSWLVFLLALALLVSPVLLLWAAPGRPWWLVFAVWGAIVGAIAYVHRRR